jgi:hypothetical protein
LNDFIYKIGRFISLFGILIIHECNAQNGVSAGINFHVERISWSPSGPYSINDGSYNPLNTKLSFEGTYITELFTFGTGISFFNEEYSKRQFYNTDLYPIEYKSKNVGILLNTQLNFSRKKNCFFFAFNNEFVITTSAQRILNGSPGIDTKILELESANFNRWVASFGIGYRLNLGGKVYLKALPYYSVNGSKKAILSEDPSFYKVGGSLGLFQVF